MRATYDTRFRDAVYAARDDQPGALVEWLRSDARLGVGERDLLADYVAGKLNRPSKRPSGGRVGTNAMRAARVEYIRRTTAGEPGASVENDICTRLGIGRSTLLKDLQGVREMLIRLDAMNPDK